MHTEFNCHKVTVTVTLSLRSTDNQNTDSTGESIVSESTLEGEKTVSFNQLLAVSKQCRCLVQTLKVSPSVQVRTSSVYHFITGSFTKSRRIHSITIHRTLLFLLFTEE